MRHAIIRDGIVLTVAVDDGTLPSILSGVLVAVELAEDESCVSGQQFDANANPRFFGSGLQEARVWTAYQFLQRFTAAERATMRSLAQTDNDVADFLQLLQAAQEVVSSDPMTISGMDYAVVVGIVTEARRNEILS